VKKVSHILSFLEHIRFLKYFIKVCFKFNAHIETNKYDCDALKNIAVCCYSKDGNLIRENEESI